MLLGTTRQNPKSAKMPLRCGSKVDLWIKMIKEINLKHFAGPFKSIPFKTYVQSLAGLVSKGKTTDQGQGQPKGQGRVQETRPVFNLSWPPGTPINDYTPRELCTVKYNDLDRTVQLCMEILNLTENKEKKCHLSKTDIKSAFRHLPIRPPDWRWFILMTRHPVTNKNFYFANKSTPFGSSISCSHFQCVSDGLEAIFRHRTSHKANNYLDDFLFATYLLNLCNDLVNQFIAICDEIRLLIAIDKTEWATELITFLGVMLDTRRQLILFLWKNMIVL